MGVSKPSSLAIRLSASTNPPSQRSGEVMKQLEGLMERLRCCSLPNR